MNVALETPKRESNCAGVRKCWYSGLAGFCWARSSAASPLGFGSFSPIPICITCDGLAAPRLVA